MPGSRALVWNFYIEYQCGKRFGCCADWARSLGDCNLVSSLLNLNIITHYYNDMKYNPNLFIFYKVNTNSVGVSDTRYFRITRFYIYFCVRR